MAAADSGVGCVENFLPSLGLGPPRKRSSAFVVDTIRWISRLKPRNETRSLHAFSRSLTTSGCLFILEAMEYPDRGQESVLVGTQLQRV